MTSSHRMQQANTARQRHDRLALAGSGWVVPSGDKLTADETQQLEGCEEIIENGLNIWYQVGEALLHIRDKKLYRSTHKTFEDYCQDRWQMTRQKASYLIRGTEVYESLSTIVDKNQLPTSESQVRPLTPLAPEEQQIVWDVVQQTAPRGKVTADHVKSVVSVLKEVTATGAIDDGTGVSIPVAEATPMHIKAAVTEETYERMARQETHIAVKQEKKAEQERKRVDLIQRADLPDAKFRVIYADPPWQYGNTMPEYVVDQEDHYPLMTMAQICAMPVKDITEENAVLFLWVTSPILEESFQVIKAWGFQYKSSFVWDKIKHNMGHYNSVRHEFLLIATRGSCQPDERKLFDSVQEIERGAHSEKPEGFRTIIDTLYPHGKRLELFARKQVEGWECYGNEIPALQP